MEEIVPGIYKLEVPIPENLLAHTNSYLIKGDGECIIIDPGFNTDESFDTLKKELAGTDTAVEDITMIIATHAHGDHYGLSGRVKEVSQAEILLHRTESENTHSWNEETRKRWQQTEQWLLSNGTPDLKLFEAPMDWSKRPKFTPPPAPDTLLDGGETISIGSFNLQVVWTPGHSPGHICLYEDTHKILFSGDHVLPVTTPNISLQDQSDLNPLGDFINALNRVKQLDVDFVCPAHEHSFKDLKKRVDEIIRHHQNRNSEILATIKTGPKTAYQISTGITWIPDRGGVSLQELAPWEKRMAVLETLAHLEAMRVDGQIDSFPRDSIIYYQHA